MTIEQATRRYLETAPITEGTRRGYSADLHAFAEWFGPRRPVDEIDVRALADWVAELGRARHGGKLAPATIARRVAAVRSMLRHALGPDQLPAASPRAAQAAPPARRAEDHRGRGAARLRSTGPMLLALRNRALFELVYSAGLRSAEAVALDLGDVDFEQELVHVRNGKGAKASR